MFVVYEIGSGSIRVPIACDNIACPELMTLLENSSKTWICAISVNVCINVREDNQSSL
jgi:hypothetical protein